MSLKLSIIIPCFNSEKTLKEAVDSCYVQGLIETDFEIIMVDDGSRDGTKLLMKEIYDVHSNISILEHTENRGGGAARNTGIRAARGRYIYCLDSDNFFAPDTVQNMLAVFEEKKCDGVAFGERRFFTGTNAKRYATAPTMASDRAATLGDIFSTPAIILDNFFFTKASYERTLGYPEHHGFDTQSFELRFLSSGGTVYIAKDVPFYHRQEVAGGSYFEREYNKGNFSRNYLYCLEDIIEKLSNEALLHIYNFDIFLRGSLSDNILLELRALKNEGKLFLENNEVRTPLLTHFEKAVVALRNEAYQIAYDELAMCATQGSVSKVITLLTLRAQFGLAGTPSAKIVSTTHIRIEAMHIPPKKLHPIYKKVPIINFLASLIIKIRNKII